MSNAFTQKPDVARFTQYLQRNLAKAAAASDTAQRHNFPQNPTMRSFSREEREGKK